MPCNCFQQRLLIELRFASAAAFTCGHVYAGQGDSFDGTRRKLTKVEHYGGGDITFTSEYSEQIITDLEEECDLPDENSDYDPETEYGDLESTDYTWEQPYEASAVLDAADNALEFGDWETYQDVKATGAVMHWNAAHPDGDGGSALVKSSHHVIWDEGAGVEAAASQMQIRFKLKGPKLPVRVDYAFSDDSSGSIDLNSGSTEETLDVPLPGGNCEIKVGDDAPEVTLTKLQIFFTPFNLL